MAPQISSVRAAVSLTHIRVRDMHNLLIAKVETLLALFGQPMQQVMTVPRSLPRCCSCADSTQRLLQASSGPTQPSLSGPAQTTAQWTPGQAVQQVKPGLALLPHSWKRR